MNYFKQQFLIDYNIIDRHGFEVDADAMACFVTIITFENILNIRFLNNQKMVYPIFSAFSRLTNLQDFFDTSHVCSFSH